MTLLETYETGRGFIKDSGTGLMTGVLKATGRGLTVMEIVALVNIRRLEIKKVQITCSVLAEKLGVTLPQITLLLTDLAKQKLIRSTYRKPDRRQRLLATTKKGAEVAAVVEGL